MIRPLDSEVCSRLRSGVAITNLTQCVEELVLNSLDAGASCISVRVDIPAFRVQVVDNGSGVKSEDLNLLGVRHATSKCHSLKDLEQLKFHGFRGEALASIREIAGVLEIVTRHKSSYKTLCKIFQNGKALEVTESCFPRGNTGTTVNVHDVFSSLPVRRKLVSDTLDFERIRFRIAAIALIHPEVSFSLLNEATGAKCLQTHKSQSILSTFSQLFGNSKSKPLREVCFEYEQFKVCGYVSLDSHHNKSLQFLYINGRLVLKTKIHKLINAILGKSALVKKSAVLDEERSEKKCVLSPQAVRGVDKYGVFVLNVRCCVTEYDVCLEPSKTLVEFQDWEGVLGCVERCVESFLVRENLTLKPEISDVSEQKNEEACTDSADAKVDNLSVFEYQAGSEKLRRTIETGNIRRSLHSSTVFRKGKTVTGDSARGHKLSSDVESDDVKHNSQGNKPIHFNQEIFLCETEDSEEQVLSDVLLCNSQSAESLQEQGELIEVTTSSIQPLTENKQTTRAEDTSLGKQHLSPTTCKSFEFQGTSLCKSSGQENETLLLGKTSRPCLPCDCPLSQENLDKRCNSSSKEYVKTSESEAVSAFGHSPTHPGAFSVSAESVSKLDEDSRTFPPPGSTQENIPKQNEMQSVISFMSAQTTERYSGAESVCKNPIRKATFAPAKRVDDSSNCPAPSCAKSAFTSPNPIMLQRTCTRKRSQGVSYRQSEAECSPRAKKCITLQRTPRRIPRLKLGRKQTDKEDSTGTTSTSGEQAVEKFDARKDDFGEPSAHIPCFPPLNTHEQAAVEADVVEQEMCSDRSDVFPGSNTDNYDVSEGCKSPLSVVDKSVPVLTDGMLSGQMYRGNFGSHTTEEDRSVGSESGVLHLGNKVVQTTQKVRETSTSCEKRSLGNESTGRAHSETKTSTSCEGTEGSSNSLYPGDGQEKGEVSTDGKRKTPSLDPSVGKCIQRVSYAGEREGVSEASWQDNLVCTHASHRQVLCGSELAPVRCNQTGSSVHESGSFEASLPSQCAQVITSDASKGMMASSSEQNHVGCNWSESVAGSWASSPSSAWMCTSEISREEMVKPVDRNQNESSVDRRKEIPEASSNTGNEWLCTFDASHGRTLYINLRTGNSSFVPPDGVKSKESDEGLVASRRAPHPSAPHLSFTCTPWMLRENRRRAVGVAHNDVSEESQIEGEICTS